MSGYFSRKRLMEIAGLDEAIQQPNTVLVTSMTNQSTLQDFPNGEPMDDQIYADALEMAEEKYSNGTEIEFDYMDAAGKVHEGEITLRGDSDYEGPYFEDDKDDSVRNKAVVDLIDQFS
tara:strand:+ start:4675 stop:5031 length:357 start_codon:yes stop_codon:yes gene_type:complete